jgi:lysophospholipid acyltransferase (LPLAT)-like uncharacterized protein
MMNILSIVVFSIFKFLVSRIAYVIMLLIGFTMRFERDNQTGVDLAKNQLIFCLWHKSTFAPMFLHRSEAIILFVAAGRRGKLFGAILTLLGYNPFPIDNYSVRSLAKRMKSGRSVCMAADGPVGPALYPKDGTKWLATLSKTPVTVLDIQYSCAITLPWRWDRYQLPLPFSKAKIVYSPLLNVDSDWSLLGGYLGK